MKKTFKKVSGCLLTSALLASGIVSSIALLPSETVHATAAIKHLGMNQKAYNQSNVESGTQYNGAKAFDGCHDATSRWATNQLSQATQEQWVSVEFHKVQFVKKFKIAFESKNDFAQTHTNIKKYRIEIKAPGATEWTVVHRQEGNITSNLQDVTLPNAVAASAVRLVVYEIDMTGWHNVSVKEVEIYGDETVERTVNKNHVLNTTGTVVTSSAIENNDVQNFAPRYVQDGIASNGQSDLSVTRTKRWSSQNTNENGDNVFIEAHMPRPTLIQEVYVDVWRNTAPEPSAVKSFDVIFTKEDGTTTTQHVDCKQVSGENYEDITRVVLNEPLTVTSFKITNFKLSSRSWPNVSIEEIEAYSNDTSAKLKSLVKEAKTLEGKCTHDSWATLNTEITAAEQLLNNSRYKVNDVVTKEACLRAAINKVNRIYTVTIQKNGEELTGASFNGVYNTVNTTEIIAPETTGDQAFVGWYKVENGQPAYLVTTNKTLKVAASNDVTYNAVYGTAPEVDKTTKLLMQNAFVSYNPTTQKYDAKFVGKVLNLPEGATITEAGLKWKVGEHTELGADAFVAKLPSSVNTHGQYSMTITGMPAGVKVSGQLFVTYTLNGETHTITSEGVKVLES